MSKHINLQKNYSLNQDGYQLKLLINIETIIPEDDSVRLLSQFVEAMDLERILSEEGILLGMNQSIQAEGSFGDLKQDMPFRRYINKGTSNVLAESILLTMAGNINKLHNKIQKGRTGTHLFPVKSA